MPSAIAGEAGDVYYRYIVEASPEEVAQYYAETLPRYGWKFVDYIPVEDVKEFCILIDEDGYTVYLGFGIGYIFINNIGEFTQVDIFHNAH
jgi:hypothetical protein